MQPGNYDPVERRRKLEDGLRRQGVLSEPLVQWLATMDMMVADLMDRVTELEMASTAIDAAMGEGE